MMSGSDHQEEEELLEDQKLLTKGKIMSDLEVIKARVKETDQESKLEHYLQSLSDKYLKQVTSMNEEPYNNAWHNTELCGLMVNRLSIEAQRTDSQVGLIALLLVCIRILSRESRNKTVLNTLNPSAIHTILRTMQQFYYDHKIQQHSCACLANLVITGESKSESESQSDLYIQVIKQVTQALTLHQNSAPLQEEGIAALINFQWSNQSNRKLILEKGGLSLVIKALKLFPNDPGVNEQACKAVWYLSDDKYSTDKLVNKGGIITLISVLKIHLNTPSVLEYGILALQRLSVTGGVKVQSLIGEEGGIPIILRGIRSHPNHQTISVRGFKLLSILVNADEVNRRDLSEDGGITDVIKMMKKYRNLQSAQEEALILLQNLSVNDEAAKQIVREGGIRSICKGMRNHSTTVQEIGLRVLCNILADKNHVKTFIQLGGLGTVFTTMNDQVTVAKIQELGCSVLFCVVRAPGNEAKIVEQGGVKSIIQAMNIHEDDLDVQRGACLLIATLVMGSNAAVKKAMGRESIEALLQTLKKHVDDVRIQEKGCNALMNIVLADKQNKEIFKELKGADIVMSCISGAEKLGWKPDQTKISAFVLAVTS